MKCETMMMKLSEQEMLDLWKLRCGYVTPRRDCYLERDDDVELDTELLHRIRAWYADLLMNAPADMLPVEDVAADCNVGAGFDGAVLLRLPDRCVRVLAVRLNGWKRDAAVMHPAGSAADLRQGVEWLRGTPDYPVAIADSDGLRLYPAPDGGSVEVAKALCVVRPADGSYQFAEPLLGTLPQE